MVTRKFWYGYHNYHQNRDIHLGLINIPFTCQSTQYLHQLSMQTNLHNGGLLLFRLKPMYEHDNYDVTVHYKYHPKFLGFPRVQRSGQSMGQLQSWASGSNRKFRLQREKKTNKNKVKSLAKYFVLQFCFFCYKNHYQTHLT